MIFRHRIVRAFTLGCSVPAICRNGLGSPGIARTHMPSYPQHTIDKQAEQLLMAGIYPTPLPACPASSRPLPARLERRAFFLLIPGSSPRHPAKRWPARSYGKLARRLFEATGTLPVIIGARGEEPIAAEICATCAVAI